MDMYAIILNIRDVTLLGILLIMEPKARVSLGIEFVGVQLVKNIVMEILEAGVKLLLWAGEGTAERWNLLIVSGG